MTPLPTPTGVSIAQAFATEEGFGPPLARATRNNNPGDISFGYFARQFGAVLETIPAGINEPARFAKFPTVGIGFQAFRLLLLNHYAGLTVTQAIYHYAPPSENDTQGYIAAVCHRTGLASDAVIDAYL
jgi:hypothetical protein